MVLAGMVGARLGPEVGDFLTPRGSRFIAGLSTNCNSQASAMLDATEIGSLVSRPLNDPDFAPVVRDYMSVPISGYRDPILVVHGVYDAIVPLPLTLALVGQFGLNGTEHAVQFLEAGHADLAEKGGLDRTLTFLDKVLPPG
jgi:hypothetical protein